MAESQAESIALSFVVLSLVLGLFCFVAVLRWDSVFVPWAGLKLPALGSGAQHSSVWLTWCMLRLVA